MIQWKANKIPIKHDVWVSEIRLVACSSVRRTKVNNLLVLLDDTFEEGTYEAVLRS